MGERGVSSMLVTAERAPFVMLPRWLLYHRQVGEGAKFLYCVLHDLVAGREGPTRPVTRAELADRCGVSANTIDRRLAELVAAGAVDKEPQILAGGQVGNIYRVWLSAPEQRPDSRLTGSGGARPDHITNGGDPALSAVDNRLPAVGEPRAERILSDGEPPRSWGASLLSSEDPTVLEEHYQELPPQPPRPAGGQEIDNGRKGQPALPAVDGARRPVGTNPRTLGTNPRAEAQLAEIARLEAEAAARQAELERRAEARRTADEAVEREAQRLEAEALAVSAALDDRTLADIALLATAGMAGPLTRSPMAIARAVVTWCRTTVAQHPGPLADAIDAGLAARLAVGERTASTPFALPAAPAGTPPLRRRVAALLRSEAEV